MSTELSDVLRVASSWILFVELLGAVTGRQQRCRSQLIGGRYGDDSVRIRAEATLVLLSGVAGTATSALAKQIAGRKPYVPLIAIDPENQLPENALPFSQSAGNSFA